MKPAPTLRSVYEGEMVSTPCEGGFVMRPAPESGLVLETPDVDHFIPWSAVTALQGELRRGKRRKVGGE